MKLEELIQYDSIGSGNQHNFEKYLGKSLATYFNLYQNIQKKPDAFISPDEQENAGEIIKTKTEKFKNDVESYMKFIFKDVLGLGEYMDKIIKNRTYASQDLLPFLAAQSNQVMLGLFKSMPEDKKAKLAVKKYDEQMERLYDNKISE